VAGGGVRLPRTERPCSELPISRSPMHSIRASCVDALFREAFGAEEIDLAVQVPFGCPTAGKPNGHACHRTGRRLCSFGMKGFRIRATARKPEDCYGSAVSLHLEQMP
jgi:hypothetical protein